MPAEGLGRYKTDSACGTWSRATRPRCGLGAGDTAPHVRGSGHEPGSLHPSTRAVSEFPLLQVTIKASSFPGAMCSTFCISARERCPEQSWGAGGAPWHGAMALDQVRKEDATKNLTKTTLSQPLEQLWEGKMCVKPTRLNCNKIQAPAWF